MVLYTETSLSEAICLGFAVKHARKAKGMTQVQLADSLSISARHLKAIESNNKKPSCGLLIKIMRILEIPSDIVHFME